MKGGVCVVGLRNTGLKQCLKTVVLCECNNWCRPFCLLFIWGSRDWKLQHHLLRPGDSQYRQAGSWWKRGIRAAGVCHTPNPCLSGQIARLQPWSTRKSTCRTSTSRTSTYLMPTWSTSNNTLRMATWVKKSWVSSGIAGSFATRGGSWVYCPSPLWLQKRLPTVKEEDRKTCYPGRTGSSACFFFLLLRHCDWDCDLSDILCYPINFKGACFRAVRRSGFIVIYIIGTT